MQFSVRGGKLKIVPKVSVVVSILLSFFGKVENNLNSWVFKFGISVHDFHIYIYVCAYTWAVM